MLEIGPGSPPPQLKIDSLRHIILSGVFVVLVFVCGAVGWAMLAKLHSAIIAQGSIKIDLNRKTVQHREGGIVHRILVREGDKVQAGQPLVELTDVTVDSNVALMQNQQGLLLARLARLDAQRQMKTAITWPKELLDMEQTPELRQAMSAEENILHQERQAVEGQIRLLQQQILGMQAQIQAEEHIIGAYQEELKAKSELQRSRYLEKTPILDLQRNLAIHQSVKSVTQQKISETNIRIGEMRRDYMQRGMTLHAELQSRFAELRERIRPSVDAKSRLVVTSPVAGIVMDMTVFTVGAIIRPGDRLMDIVPEGEPLIIEADVPVKEITKIHVGQTAKIQIAAYSPSEVPALMGKITYVSPDRTTVRGPMGEMPIYKIHAAITDENLEKYKIDLTAGLPIVVYILTREKSVMDYILDPITQRLGQGMRE